MTNRFTLRLVAAGVTAITLIFAVQAIGLYIKGL